MQNNVILFFHISILCAPPSVYCVYTFVYTYCLCIHSGTGSLNALPMVSSFFSLFLPFYL